MQMVFKEFALQGSILLPTKPIRIIQSVVIVMLDIIAQILEVRFIMFILAHLETMQDITAQQEVLSQSLPFLVTIQHQHTGIPQVIDMVWLLAIKEAFVLEMDIIGVLLT